MTSSVIRTYRAAKFSAAAAVRRRPEFFRRRRVSFYGWLQDLVAESLYCVPASVFIHKRKPTSRIIVIIDFEFTVPHLNTTIVHI
jgi:hypothetical protein